MGCTCPDSVFDHVVAERGVRIGETRLERRIDVGRRLLVYVLRGTDADDALAALPGLLRLGRRERDGGGYNRLRIVLVLPEPEASLGPAQQALASLPERDDRVHLHAVGEEEVRGI